MQLFDRTFWRMTFSFLLVILVGIGGMITIGYFSQPEEANQAGFQDHL